MDEVAEPAERALAPDRPLQSIPQRRIILPLSEGRHVPPAVPAGRCSRTGANGRAPPPRRRRRPPRPSSRGRPAPPAPSAARGGHASRSSASTSSPWPARHVTRLTTDRRQQPSDPGRLDVHRLRNGPTDRPCHLGPRLRVGDDPSIGKGEHRQVRPVPPAEGVVDRIREVHEGVRRSDRDDIPRGWHAGCGAVRLQPQSTARGNTISNVPR